MNLDRVIAVRNRKTVYKDGDQCIKVFDASYRKSDILNEALNMARIEEAGINVPKLHEVAVIDGNWALVMDFIPGKTLGRMMDENPGERKEILSKFVEIQLEIHKHRSPELPRLKNKLMDRIGSADIEKNMLSTIRAKLDELQEGEQILHGDLNPSNVVLREDGVPFILDWSHVTRGDAAADAAQTSLAFELYGDNKGAEQYLRLFCKKSGLDMRNISEWVPILAASQLSRRNAMEREFLRGRIRESIA